MCKHIVRHENHYRFLISNILFRDYHNFPICGVQTRGKRRSIRTIKEPRALSERKEVLRYPEDFIAVSPRWGVRVMTRFFALTLYVTRFTRTITLTIRGNMEHVREFVGVKEPPFEPPRRGYNIANNRVISQLSSILVDLSFACRTSTQKQKLSNVQ